MAFGVKHFETITASIVNFFVGNNRTLTDFRVGARLRTAFEAVAIELEQIYYQLYIGISDGIQNGVYNSFNFALLQAAAASGTVTFTSTSPAPVGGIIIPAGTQVSTQGSDTVSAVVYQTTDTVIIPAGQSTVDALVVASVDGSVGNAQAGGVSVLVGAPAGIAGVTNAVAFFTGRDLETQDQRAARFLKYIDNLSRATLGALENAALGVANVVGAYAFESPKLSVLVYESPLNTYTDIGFTVNIPVGSPAASLPAYVSVNDALYIGSSGRFSLLQFILDYGMSGGTFAWEYWNGSVWSMLPVTSDSTSYLRQSGFLNFSKPADWRATDVNAVMKFWIRLRVTNPSVARAATIVEAKAAPLPGVVELVVMDASATLPPSLYTAVSNVIDGYRAAGIRVSLTGPTVTYIPVTVNLTLDALADATADQAAIKQAISNYISTFTLGQRLSFSALVQFVENQSSDILDAVMITPTDSIDVSYDEVLRPGVITVNVQQ